MKHERKVTFRRIRDLISEHGNRPSIARPMKPRERDRSACRFLSRQKDYTATEDRIGWHLDAGARICEILNGMWEMRLVEFTLAGVRLTQAGLALARREQ